MPIFTDSLGALVGMSDDEPYEVLRPIGQGGMCAPTEAYALIIIHAKIRCCVKPKYELRPFKDTCDFYNDGVGALAH